MGLDIRVNCISCNKCNAKILDDNYEIPRTFDSIEDARKFIVFRGWKFIEKQNYQYDTICPSCRTDRWPV